MILSGSLNSLGRKITGKVFDIHLSEDMIDLFEEDTQKTVTGYVRDMNGIRARIIREIPPSYPYKEAVPSLEDVYMYSFGETVHAF